MREYCPAVFLIDLFYSSVVPHDAYQYPDCSIVFMVSLYQLLPYYLVLYNNQINARALIGQSTVGYCAGKLTEKSRVF